MDKKHCLWRPVELGTINLDATCRTYVCCLCGRETTVPDSIGTQEHLATLPPCDIRIETAKNEEPKPTPQPPGLMKKSLKFAKATSRWIASGRPTRDEQEIARIFDEICLPCEFFNENRQTCTVCGCRIRKNSKALSNKIAMKTEHCPEGKW